MSDLYAFGPTSKDDNITYLSVSDLVSRLKSKSILKFLFIPAAPHILLRYHTSSVCNCKRFPFSHVSTSQLASVRNFFNYCLPSPLLQSIAKQKLSDFRLFHVRPTKVIPFTIKLNEALSRNKIKTILFSFVKTLPISKDMLLLLQSQTKVTFKGHLFLVTVTPCSLPWACTPTNQTSSMCVLPT